MSTCSHDLLSCLHTTYYLGDLREVVLSPHSERLVPQQGLQGLREAVSLEPDQPLEVLKEGWLLKQSKKLKKWQKRYFVLDNVALYYCRSPTSVPDGFFAIRRCQVCVCVCIITCIMFVTISSGMIMWRGTTPVARYDSCFCV